MTEYLVFPAGTELMVKASNANVARNKYVKHIDDYDGEALIIVPCSHGHKTINQFEIQPLYKCDIPKIE